LTALDKIFAFELGGNLRQYPGNYSVYLDFKKAEEEASKQAAILRRQREVQPVVEKSQMALDTNKRKLSSKQKREFEMIEGKIAQLEAERQKSTLLCSAWG